MAEKKTIFFLEIVSEGTVISGTAHTTEEHAKHWLAEWCRSQWLEQNELDPDDFLNPAEVELIEDEWEKPLSDDDNEATSTYFEHWDPEESFDLDELLLDPPLPGEEPVESGHPEEAV
jgi:hypothetical protein